MQENTLRTDFWGDPSRAALFHRRDYPQQTAAVVALAEEICQNRFTFRGHWEMERTHVPVGFAGAIDWHHVENNDPEWCYALNRYSFLVTLGQAWRFTSEGKYVQAAQRLWKDWIARVPLCEASKPTAWRSIEAGLRCESWLRALALFAGSGLPDGTLAGEITNSLAVHAEYLLESHAGFQKLSNWGVLQDHGLLLLGLAFGRENWCDTAAGRLTEELDIQVMADGTHWEQSPLYHCEVLHCCLDAVLAARKAGYALPQAIEDKTHAMAKALALMLRPDGRLVCQSDSDEVDARDLLALAALLFEDGALKGRAGEALPPEALWSMADVAVAYGELAAKQSGGSVALPNSGNYMLWDGTGENAGFLHLHCGSLGSGHGHADLLHVDLVQNGESVLCDSGRYTYVDTPLRRELKSPAAHNVVRVDEEDFSQPQGSWGYSAIAEPLKGEYHFTPKVDYVSGAHLGYSPLGVLHRRHVLRLGKGLWVMWDALYAEGAHRYQQYFHFGPEGRFEAGENGGTYIGKRVAARLALAGNAPQLTASKAPGSREYNRLEQHDCLVAAYEGRGFFSAPAVVAVEDGTTPPQLAVKRLPVHLKDEGRVVPCHVAQGLEIDCNGQQCTLLLVHNEVIAEVDLLCAGALEGYGKVLVLPPGQKNALCMAW